MLGGLGALGGLGGLGALGRLGALGAAAVPSGAEQHLPGSAGSGERLSPEPDPMASARRATRAGAGSPGSPRCQP